MILLTEITVIDEDQQILDIGVTVEYWIREGQPSSSISEPIDDEVIIDSIMDDTGYDWEGELSQDVMRSINLQIQKQIREEY
jgi:hypothetical protein